MESQIATKYPKDQSIKWASLFAIVVLMVVIRKNVALTHLQYF